jgi:hypothetical protein
MYINVSFLHIGTKFHTISCNISLRNAVKPTAACRFRSAAMLLFYILLKNYLNRNCLLFEALLTHNIQEQRLSASSVASNSQFITGTILILLMLGH